MTVLNQARPSTHGLDFPTTAKDAFIDAEVRGHGLTWEEPAS